MSEMSKEGVFHSVSGMIGMSELAGMPKTKKLMEEALEVAYQEFLDSDEDSSEYEEE